MKKRQGLVQAARAVLFCAITGALLLGCTYLFRSVQFNQRPALLNFYLEEDDSMDVVFLGASTVYRFWDPYLAWEEHGMVSYNYAVADMQEAVYIPAIEDMEKHQDIRLLVLDARRFIAMFTEDTESETARYFLDGMNYGPARFKAVHTYCEQYDIPLAERPAYYFELMFYHSDYDALLSGEHWKLADNRMDRADTDRFPKGFGPMLNVVPFERPAGLETTECANLAPRQERMYRELLEYCSGKDYPVTLVVSPCVVTEDEMAEYNALEKIAEEYGIDFWNGNRYVDEMGLDFATDFYNDRHANFYGAEKFTTLFASWLKDHYEIPDRRGDEKYERIMAIDRDLYEERTQLEE